MRGTFVGANIKGTPAMKASKVSHDLRRIKQEANVFGVQEFKWPWYWSMVVIVLQLGTKWSAFPSRFKGLADSVEGAQALFWERKKWRRLRTYVTPSYNFDTSVKGIMTRRWVRAVLLRTRDKNDKFAGWFLSTHFVVGGDRANDEARRKTLLKQNIACLDRALARCVRSGYPIMGELDGNINEHGTWAYTELMNVLNKYHAVLHGTVGVEYAFTIANKHGEFVVKKARIIPTEELYTDHEARVLDFEGVSKEG